MDILRQHQEIMMMLIVVLILGQNEGTILLLNFTKPFDLMISNSNLAKENYLMTFYSRIIKTQIDYFL